MSEELILISHLNDFVFCPVSIYFHSLSKDTDNIMYQDACQINGTAAHDKIDKSNYSDRKSILQSISVYSEKYKIFGKIDVFDIKSGILTERKKKISKIYDGYVFQLYAQCIALREMGYAVNEIRFYSMDDNKVHKIALPENNADMFEKFEKTIEAIDRFSFESYRQKNKQKCLNCIYEPLCSYSVILTEDDHNDNCT